MVRYFVIAAYWSTTSYTDTRLLFTTDDAWSYLCEIAQRLDDLLRKKYNDQLPDLRALEFDMEGRNETVWYFTVEDILHAHFQGINLLAEETEDING